MKPILLSRRKTLELLFLLVVDLIIYLVWGSWEVISLLSLGFVWNWVASQDLQEVFDNRRYRFSTMKMVKNLQNLIQRPLERAPAFTRAIARCLPAGIFWVLVIYANDSHMPWWPTFVGSAFYEILQLEISSFRKEKAESL